MIRRGIRELLRALGLVGLASRALRGWSRIFSRQFLRDVWLYWSHRLKGASYLVFYADRMDHLARASPESATGKPENKLFQLQYLRAKGLRPESTLLDYGCGTAAAGIHFIKYLLPSHYVGVDISKACLEVAERRVVEFGLADREPDFIHIADGDLRGLGDKRFDFIWAQSVFTHLPPEEILRVLRQLLPLIRGGSKFYATFASASFRPGRRRLKDWYYADDALSRIAESLNLKSEIMGDWRHPDSSFDKLMKFTVPSADTTETLGGQD